MAKFEFVAVDFDGTLCEYQFPEIGAPKYSVVRYVKALAEDGSKIILNTCRENGTRNLLDEAVAFCEEQEIPLYAVNENPDNPYLSQYGLNQSKARKVYADLYIDDKALDPELILEPQAVEEPRGSLFDYMKREGRDFDAWDERYGVCVTVCQPGVDDSSDPYDVFCNELCKRVQVMRPAEGDNPSCAVNWGDLIESNAEKFQNFMEKHWKRQYPVGGVEFIVEWIKELHAYVAGCVPTVMYLELVELVKGLESVVESTLCSSFKAFKSSKELQDFASREYPLTEEEAACIMGYMEGHGYTLGVMGGEMCRMDLEDSKTSAERYPIHDAVLAIFGWNGELLEETLSEIKELTVRVEQLRDYYSQLKKDDTLMDDLLSRILHLSAAGLEEDPQ